MHHYLLKHAPVLCPSGDVADAIYMRRGVIAAAETAPPSVPVIDCSGYVLFPGLVNAHDHLELNHFPRTRYRECYSNAHEWGEDVSKHLDTAPFVALRRKRLAERCLIGGLKNLLSGVTTVAHHNPLHRPLRQRWFPVDVLRRYVWEHSLYFGNEDSIRAALAHIPADIPFIIHLAEGTDAVAAAEYPALSRLGAARPNTLLVHGVGLSLADRVAAIQQIGGLVWCPSTNLYLLGATADVQAWATASKLALGSDSRLTADGDLLDELRCAWATEQLNATQLLHTVTDWPAHMLGLPHKGRLQLGSAADVLALPLPGGNAPLTQPLYSSQRSDVGMVIRGGVPQIGDAQLLAQFRTERFEAVAVDGRPKLMQRYLARRVRRSSLQEPGLSL